ncbi:MAG: hypothetical protein Q9212_003024 [Teloschistes hypoglaucus]
MDVQFCRSRAELALLLALRGTHIDKMAVASAVIVPEMEEQPLQSPGSGKRRGSSFSQDSSKRPKLSSEPTHDRVDAPTATDRIPDRRSSGQLEERKRGQRLFGALLGTLSQSSSSTAQKRRTEFEKKQQAKLKEQAEEYDEQKKQRLESIMAARRKEQKKYDKQSTTAEPKLYYKPWELLPSEDAKIKSQIEAVEEQIQRETAEANSNVAANLQPAQETPTQEPKVEPEREPEHATATVGSESDIPQKDENLPNEAPTDQKADNPPPETEPAPAEPSKDNEDDGGEMVEADEDMVIY